MSFLASCEDCHSSYIEPSEDHRAQANVEGSVWTTLRTTLKIFSNVLSGGDGRIQSLNLMLHNRACFRYISVTDNSVAREATEDGFDSCVIEAVSIFCPEENPTLNVETLDED
eukprot:snap_masked-scaffold_5-processed-gene-0.22-mRNA-1 protein AED:1.00 eAED:1.00 QI:0/-1/0/0/-1/1/1/0/112